MNPLKGNALMAATNRATYKTNLNRDYKRFPPFGKQLMDMRLAGKMPASRVIVTFDWSLGRAYSRVVIPENVPLAQLNFVYLAGLAVEVVYHARHAHLISELVEAILAVSPSCLITFALDLIDTGNAVTLIKPYQPEQIAEVA